MIVKNKTLTFHINNYAYTIDIGPDLDNEMEQEITSLLNLDKEITTKELLLAYLKKTHELVNFKKEIENEIQCLKEFQDTKINA